MQTRLLYCEYIMVYKTRFISTVNYEKRMFSHRNVACISIRRPLCVLCVLYGVCVLCVMFVLCVLCVLYGVCALCVLRQRATWASDRGRW